MKISFKLEDKKFNSSLAEIAKLSALDLKIGVTEAKNRSRGGSTLAQQAAWNEFGTDDGYIPERAAHRQCFDENQAELWSRISAGAEKIIDGKATAKQVIDQTSDWYLTKLQEKVLYFSFPANAKTTIEKKGFDDPLIETGETYDALGVEKMENGNRRKALKMQADALSEMQRILKNMSRDIARTQLSTKLREFRSALDRIG